ncbi:hypothetical protein ABZP36_006220 [Zizania latifolia]
MMEAAAVWGGLNSGVVLSLIAVLWTVVWQNLQRLQLHTYVGRHMNRHTRRLAALVDPYHSVAIAEYDGGRMKRSEAFEEVKAYLSASCARDVRHVRAEAAKDADKLVLSMVDGEEVLDVAAEGVTVWWLANSTPPPRTDGGYWGGRVQENRRSYQLFFLDRHRDLVINTYLPRVRKQGRAVMVKNRQRKLFTNISYKNWSYEDGLTQSAWSHVVFEHPKTFDTLAMEPVKKKEIMEDLNMFKNGKESYARVGKAWKRGYLLYGPPGTGKSAIIAAMANYLDYDIYDIELTSVNTNTDLRKLFIQTTSKSIIVIEDIDCSLDLTGARKKKKEAAAADEANKDGARPAKPDEKDPSSKVTLSGLLNFIDGLWSACGGERLIVFTTNHVEKLDPALIRRGRMDKHIEMSYCGFEAFKFLANIYLEIDSHELFPAVQALLSEVEMTPADVAENLTPKSTDDNADSCLRALVSELEKKVEDKANGVKNGQDEGEAEDDN